MYIAVISDNIASRKHTERLLDRTSDAIMSQTGNLYIEAFGNPETMWPLFKRFDLFLTDATEGTDFFNALIRRFEELEIVSQVFVCLQPDSSLAKGLSEKGFHILFHPLHVETLSEQILNAHEQILTDSSTKKIVEFRGDNETHYIKAESILYAKETRNVVELHLTDGEILTMSGDIFAFMRSVEVYEEFKLYNKEVIVNTQHVQKKQGRQITLANNEIIKLSLFGKHN